MSIQILGSMGKNKNIELLQIKVCLTLCPRIYSRSKSIKLSIERGARGKIYILMSR